MTIHTEPVVLHSGGRASPRDKRKAAQGAGILIVAGQLWFFGASRTTLPTQVHAGCAAIMALGVVLVLVGGIPWLRRLSSHDPMMRDYAWSRRGETFNGIGAGLGQIVAAIVIAVPVTGFAWFAWVSGAWPITVFAGVVSLFIGAMLVGGVVHLAASIKYGTSRLRFRAFPFRVGQIIDVEFSCARAIHATTANITLRFVTEARVSSTNSDGDTRMHTQCTQRWAETRAVAIPSAADDGTRIALQFDLPEGDYGTRLSGKPRRYWELEVAAETPGLDYRAVFLVPVYGVSGVAGHHPQT